MVTDTPEPTDPPALDDAERCPHCWNWDPLAATRTAGDPVLDVLLSGTVFYDLIFSGLTRQPNPGEELWSTGMGSSPGGIANLATATARLGLRTGLVAGFGDDAFAAWLWSVLGEQEHIDLSASVRFEGRHSPITVAMSYQGDRAMLSHGHPLPRRLDQEAAQAPSARAALVDLAGDTGWWSTLALRGTKIWADIGFDESGRWPEAQLEPLSSCYAFTPNAVEAMNYTRTESPTRAVRALAERVGLAIVTDGADGSYAIDQYTGEEAYCPALPVEAIDPTGAGDVFASACVLGTLANWPLEQRLRFASLCAALAVQQFGGALAAPGWGDIADWWRGVCTRADGGDLKATHVRRDHEFLDDLVPTHEVQGVRRAEATFALHADI